MGAVKTIAVVALLGLVGVGYIIGSGGAQSADLGQVLDRTEQALVHYDKHLEREGIEEMDTAHVGQLNALLTATMNRKERFYDTAIGVAMTQKAAFLGYADKNANGRKDKGEDKIFMVEIDNENQRLIATDVSGNATHSGVGSGGFFIGIFSRNVGSRQAAAGVRPGSFNSRQSTPRSAYRAPSSARSRARSGGIGRGK